MVSGRSTDVGSGRSAAPRSTDVATCREDGGSATTLRPDSHSKQYIPAPDLIVRRSDWLVQFLGRAVETMAVYAHTIDRVTGARRGTALIYPGPVLIGPGPDLICLWPSVDDGCTCTHDRSCHRYVQTHDGRGGQRALILETFRLRLSSSGHLKSLISLYFHSAAA